VPETTLKTIERGQTDPDSSTRERIQKAFDQAGVMFLKAGEVKDGGPGFRLKNRA
jgi:hypothetical protein